MTNEELQQTLAGIAHSLRYLTDVATKHENSLRHLAEIVAQQDLNHRRLRNLVDDITDGTVRLLRTAEAHEERISRLENDKPEES